MADSRLITDPSALARATLIAPSCTAFSWSALRRCRASRPGCSPAGLDPTILILRDALPRLRWAVGSLRRRRCESLAASLSSNALVHPGWMINRQVLETVLTPGGR